MGVILGVAVLLDTLLVRLLLLPAVLAYDRAQHVVVLDQHLPRGLEALAVVRGELHLEVDVATDVTEVERAATADPVGLLHVGERKRFVTGREVRGKRRDVRNLGCPLCRPVFAEHVVHDARPSLIWLWRPRTPMSEGRRAEPATTGPG